MHQVPGKKGSLKTALSFLARFRHLRRRALAAIVCGCVSSALQLLVPLSSAVIINQAIPRKDLGLLLGIAAGLCLTTLISMGAAYGEFNLSAVLRERMSVELQRDLFEHLQHLPTSFFKTHDSGYVMSRIGNDPETAVDFPAGLTTLGRSLVWFGAAFLLVPAVSPLIGLVVILVIPLYILILVAFNRRIKERFMLVQETTANSSRELFESLGGVHETKAYGGEGYRARRYVRALSGRARNLVKGRRLMALGGHSTQVVMLAVTLFILVYGGAQVMRGRLTLGELVALNALVGYLLLPVNSMVQQAFQIQRSMAAVERLNEVLALHAEPRTEGMEPGGPARGDIRFEGVSFGYDEKSVLEDVSFRIRPGETVLFAGPSGQGKTSLMSLLPRFYSPAKGRVRLDGMAVDKLRLGWLRRQIAYVCQDTFLFSDTVFNNIRIGNPSASPEQVQEAARRANALDFIEALPQGFQTRVGERGCRLSGGQRQRIAIARALLKGAPILVLDEATSAVDPGTEAAVYQALDRLMEGRTTLVVAHHAEAFLHQVDRILQVEGTRVKERVSVQGHRLAAAAQRP